jgi:hypothetical protein
VTNGVAVRMAVLYLLLGGNEPAIGGAATELAATVDPTNESDTL